MLLLLLPLVFAFPAKTIEIPDSLIPLDATQETITNYLNHTVNQALDTFISDLSNILDPESKHPEIVHAAESALEGLKQELLEAAMDLVEKDLDDLKIQLGRENRTVTFQDIENVSNSLRIDIEKEFKEIIIKWSKNGVHTLMTVLVKFIKQLQEWINQQLDGMIRGDGTDITLIQRLFGQRLLALLKVEDQKITQCFYDDWFE